jgi:hypothetical protein
MLLVLGQKLKLPAYLNNESSKKLPPIDMAERSPIPILLQSMAALLKQFSKSFNAINIGR